MYYAISDTNEIPAAIHLGKADNWRWWFACSLCGHWTLQRNRWDLAGAYVCQGCAGEHNEMSRRLQETYEENKRRNRREAICDMQEHCGVSYPDSFDSPGAQWLYRLHNAITEAWESGRFGENSGEEESDVIWTLADNSVPIYTHERWSVFIDLCLYDEDVDLSGEIDNADNLTDAIYPVFHDIASRALHTWVYEKRENSKCEECDEFPCECCEECGKYFDCECESE